MADNYEINVTLDEVFGTGIRSVDQTVTSDEPDGQNEITVTLTNGETNTFYVKNGSQGPAGADGKDGTSSGYPVPVTLVSEMTDPHTMYLYGGNEEGYSANHIYHLEDGELVDYGEYGAPADYVQNARRDTRFGFDQGGTIVYEDHLVYLDKIRNGEPQTVQFSERLYRETGNNEDGSLTQKAATEAIESSMSLPMVTYGEAAEYDPAVMDVTIDPNTLYVLTGIGTTFTSVEITRNVAIEKEDRLNRYLVRIVTGGSLANLSFSNATPALLFLKTETTYDIEIINGIVHVWEDGQAIGNVLDTADVTNAITDWMNNHPEATTTVPDRSITTAKLALSVIDDTLSTPGAAADAKAVGDELATRPTITATTTKIQFESDGPTVAAPTFNYSEGRFTTLANNIGRLADLETTEKSSTVGAINELKSQIAQLGAIPTAVKLAMDSLFQKMAIIGEDDTSHASEVATIHAWATAVNLLSISAVFDQGQNVVYDVDDLDSLREYLTVTATYDDGTTPTVTTYTLSGTLEEGTCTITVEFDGMTDTFDVVVSPKIIKDISGEELTYTGLKFSKPYYEASTTRLSYTPFDILIESGKKYQIKAYTDVETADMSVHIYNTTAVSAANSNQTFANANADVAWRNTLDFTYDASATINGKAPRAIRVSFKYDSSDSTVSSKFINRVTVREVK